MDSDFSEESVESGAACRSPTVRKRPHRFADLSRSAAMRPLRKHKAKSYENYPTDPLITPQMIGEWVTQK